jgi:hypothetical protein
MIEGFTCIRAYGSFEHFRHDDYWGPVGTEKKIFAFCTVSASMSLDIFCLVALLLIMGCGVEGVTALHGVGLIFDVNLVL